MYKSRAENVIYSDTMIRDIFEALIQRKASSALRLASELKMSPEEVSEAFEQLEDAGLIESEGNPRIPTIAYYYLTPEGAQIARRLVR